MSGNVGIEDIMMALGEQKALALPALHAFSGADNVGKFNRIGKAKWLKAFLKSSNDVIDAMIGLMESKDVTEKHLQYSNHLCVTHTVQKAYR